ncbi:MAG: RDD family protein [Chloroflexota bacterium]|nr:RDD family protein [Chloroflexota bacterium]
MTVQATSSALAPAALAPRIIALIIDGLVLGICGILIVGIFVNDVSIVGSVIRGILFAALGFLYYGYTWTAWRATPGQRLMGLLTVNAADGAALTWNQAMMRWAYLFGPSVVSNLFSAQTGSGLGAIVGLVVLGYYIYLLYTTAQDPRRQGFHDKQAGSLVVVKTAA